MALEVKPGAAGPARPLFQTGLGAVSSRYQPYCVTPDGQRFLVIERSQTITNEQPLHVIVNWPAALVR